MTSEQDQLPTPTAFTESLDDDDVSLLEDDDDDEVTISVAAPTAVTPITTVSVSLMPVRSDVNKVTPLDDSQRRLFQRLWTDEDEIELLQGFLEYNNRRVIYNNHNDTSAFYDSIKDKLQLDFNKNQLVEKLRRLKKKYRNVISKISSGKEYVFKTAHEQVTFEISSKIWSNDGAVLAMPVVNDVSRFDDDEANNNGNGNFAFNLNESNGNGVVYPSSAEKKARSRKRLRSGGVKVEEKVSQPQVETVGGVGGCGLNLNQSSILSVVEETVKSCLLPLFKELVESLGNGGRGGLRGMGVGSGGMNLNLDPFSLSFGGLMNFPFGDVSDEKWRKQHILELEVCSKRLELVQDQIKLQLEELRS